MISSKRASAFVVLLLLAIVGPMCGGGGGGGGGGSTGGAGTFSVLSHSPLQGANPVARTATIFCVVNGIVDPATLTASNITVMGNNPIPCTFAWNLTTSSIEITPVASMDKGVLHTVTLFAGVKTTGGASMIQNSFSFTTVSSDDVALPTFGGITSISGANTTQMTLNWADGNDPGGTPAANLFYDVYQATSTGAQNFGLAPVATTLVGGATSIVVSALAPDVTYFFIVRCRDSAGNLSIPNIPTQEQFLKTLASFNTNIFLPIIKNICVTCHTPGGKSQFMNLDLATSSDVRLIWVNQAADQGAGPPQACQNPPITLLRVVPNQPNNSLVYLKISMTNPPCGVQMPEALPPLPTVQQTHFYNWINEGALDN